MTRIASCLIDRDREQTNLRLSDRQRKCESIKNIGRISVMVHSLIYSHLSNFYYARRGGGIWNLWLSLIQVRYTTKLYFAFTSVFDINHSDDWNFYFNTDTKMLIDKETLFYGNILLESIRTFPVWKSANIFELKEKTFGNHWWETRQTIQGKQLSTQPADSTKQVKTF